MNFRIIIPVIFYLILTKPVNSCANDHRHPGHNATYQSKSRINPWQHCFKTYIELKPFGYNLLKDLLSTTEDVDFESAKNSIDVLLLQVGNKKISSEAQYLRKMFLATHEKFLRTFCEYSDMNEIFESGKYNCLTATCLFSILLERLNYNYQIIETNYHIFIVVYTRRGEVLIETTDEENGFVTDSQQIDEITRLYKQNKLTSSVVAPGGKRFSYPFKLYQVLEPQKLPGLLYFNQAVKAFNAESWETCADRLTKAKSIYNSPRIDQLISILISTIQRTHFSAEKKRMLYERLSHSAKR